MRSQHFRSGAHYISFSEASPGDRVPSPESTPATITTLPDAPHKEEFRSGHVARTVTETQMTPRAVFQGRAGAMRPDIITEL